MVRSHHQLNGHKFEQAPGADDGQRDNQSLLNKCINKL